MLLCTAAIAVVTAAIASFFVLAVRTFVAAFATMSGRLRNGGGSCGAIRRNAAA